MPIRLTPTAGTDLGPAASWDDARPRILGRSPDSDIVISIRGISKIHCQIERLADGFYVKDLGSSNGTWVNGQAVAAPTRLDDGATLALGAYMLRVQLSARPAEEPVSFEIHDRKEVLRINGSRLVIGRQPDCALVLEVRGLSREHCAIEHEAAGFVLVDLQSKNGSYVNGQRVVKQLLSDGDRLTLGGPTRSAEHASVVFRIAARVCTLDVERAGTDTTGIRKVLFTDDKAPGAKSSEDLLANFSDSNVTIRGTSEEIAAMGAGTPGVAAPAAATSAPAPRPAAPAPAAPAPPRPATVAPPASPATPSAKAAAPPAEPKPAPPAVEGPKTTARATLPGGGVVAIAPPDAVPAPAAARPAAPAAAAVAKPKKSAPSEAAPLSQSFEKVAALAQSRELSRVIQSLDKQKAKFRGQKWEPTSDLLTNPVRYWGNLAAFGVVMLAALGALAFGGVKHFNPGRVAVKHANEGFLDIQKRGSCRPCHSPFHAVTNDNCNQCHANPAVETNNGTVQVAIAAPHDAVTLAAAGFRPMRCAGCHLEHQADLYPLPPSSADTPAKATATPATPDPAAGGFVSTRAPGFTMHRQVVSSDIDQLPVDREACLGCHAALWQRSGRLHGLKKDQKVVKRDTPGEIFLNVFFSSSWIHTQHLGPLPACADCHRSAEDQLSGRVTATCQECHGGPKEGAVADARCLTCHYLHRKEKYPLILQRKDATRTAAAGPATTGGAGGS